MQITNPDSQVTDNPAYGLSSKNWLEAKEDADDGGNLPEVMKMEPLENANRDNLNETLMTNIPPDVSASQQNKNCDVNTVPKMNQVNSQSYFQHNKMELKAKHAEEASDPSKHDLHSSDLKLGKLTWSVLRHRQHSGDILRHCDKSSNVIEPSTNDRSQHVDPQDKSNDPIPMSKAKKNTKDRSFPLSLMRPIAKISDMKPETLTHHLNQVFKNDLLRQRPVQRNVKENYPISRTKKEAENLKKLSSDILGLNSNPLSDIAQIKTEESVQEWLARIGESANNTWPDESEERAPKTLPPRPPWSLANNTDEEKDKGNLKLKAHIFHTDTNDILLRKNTHNSSVVSQTRENLMNDDLKPKTESDTTDVLCSASKASPAHVPMVVMQCSRLHSHIGGKPPFQQTSLPMGTLVTALYQESDWLYVQTPHGVEGFVLSSNCAPIGTINEPAHASRRPWEPCDFPVQFSIQKKYEFGRQQGSYIPAKLPTNNGKQAAPYVNTVKMKTNFYSDRHFSYTFKSKDSIKTAKTVTDILRSSPETKVSNQ